MPKFLPYLLVVIFPLATPAQTLTTDQWRQDVLQFKAQLVKRHMNAFHNVSQEEFNRDIDQLLNDLPSLQDYQVVVRLMQITSKIGDGHTGVHLPRTYRRYPITVNWFGDELRVIGTTADYKQILGGRLMAIDGHGIEDVMSGIRSVMSQDENKWYELGTSVAFITVSEILVTLSIAKHEDQAEFLFLDSANHETRITLPALPADPKRQWISASRTTPLFRQQLNNPFWFTYVADIDAVYLSFKKYDDLRRNADAVFDFIKSKNAGRLIVDLRLNGGGDFLEGRKFLISRIADNPVINQKGNLFVITGRRTFSAAMVNSIDFHKDTNAILVGEPPGEVPNSYSENDEFKLSNSNLVISYSTRYYKFLEEDVRAFEPEVRIDPTWDSFRNGRDPVMEWIVANCHK